VLLFKMQSWFWQLILGSVEFDLLFFNDIYIKLSPIGYYSDNQIEFKCCKSYQHSVPGMCHTFFCWAKKEIYVTYIL